MKYLFVKSDNYYLFSFILILLLFLTTNHYSYDQILELNQLDSKSYYLISKNSPKLIYAQEIPHHHYQRFFLPYIFGIISKIANFEIITVYKIFTLITLILITIVHKILFKKINQNFETSITLLSIIIFSPYLSRYVMSIPFMIVDLVFVLIGYLIILSFLSKSKWMIFLLQFSLIFRLSGIAYIFAYLVNLIFDIKKNTFRFIFLILITLLTICILDFFSKKYSGSEFNNLHYLGLIKEFNIDKLFNTLVFTLKPILCFVPIIFLTLFSKLNKNMLISKKTIFYLIIAVLLIGQPILGGELVTGNNIFRLSSLALPFMIVYFSIISKTINVFKEYYLILIFINFLFSLHPRYSIISFVIF